MEVIGKGGICSTTGKQQPPSWKTKFGKGNELRKRIISVSGANSAKQRQENLLTLRANNSSQPQVRRYFKNICKRAWNNGSFSMT